MINLNGRMRKRNSRDKIGVLIQWAPRFESWLAPPKTDQPDSGEVGGRGGFADSGVPVKHKRCKNDSGDHFNLVMVEIMGGGSAGLKGKVGGGGDWEGGPRPQCLRVRCQPLAVGGAMCPDHKRERQRKKKN